MKKQHGRKEVYPRSLKIAIAKEWLKGEKGYGKLAKEYGLENPATVRHFVRWYKDNYEEDQDLVSQPLTEQEQEDNLALRKKVQQLEEQLHKASLKIDAQDIMINIAEDQLNIDIRKKSGTKQSTK